MIRSYDFGINHLIIVTLTTFNKKPDIKSGFLLIPEFDINFRNLN